MRELFHILPVILLLSATAGSAVAQPAKGIATGKVSDVLKIPTGPDNPRNSEGDFIALNDGRILYVYTHYTGSSPSDHGHAYLAGRYSSDGGRTWTSEDVRIVGQEGDMNVMSVSLLRLNSGKIAMFYLRKNSTSDCIPVMRISGDEGRTWSAPRACITDRAGYFVLNNDRVIQLPDGRILFAVALHQSPGDTAFSQRGRLWTYYSDDEGATWTAGQEVPNPAKVITQEPGLVLLKTGEILLFTRTMSGYQYFSRSRDRGRTWSAVTRGNLASPCSPATIERIPSTGDLVVVWNDNGVDQRRTPLNIAISGDEGRTWRHRRTLEDDPEGMFCYTAIHFTGEDLLIGYFDWKTVGITVKRVALEGLYEGGQERH